MEKFKKGDIIKGANNVYGVTDSDMTKAEVLEVYKNISGKELLSLKVLEHESLEDYIGDVFTNLYPKHFELADARVEEDKTDKKLGKAIAKARLKKYEGANNE